MKRSRKSVWLGICLLILVGVGGLSTWRRSVYFPVPDQNAYQEFLRAARFVGDSVPNYSTKETLEQFVSLNRAVYPIVRAALGRPCMVPIETSPEWDARHQGQDVPRLKQLTHAMIARARLAECEGQTETAFEAYKEAFCFADAIGRGGLSLDFLNSIACRALVLRHCQSLLPELAADQRAEFLRLIQRSAAEQETAAAVAKRTRQWQRATFGLRGWLETWRSLVLETLQASSRSTLAAKKVFYEQQYEKVVCDRLRATDYLKQTNAEPDSPATGSQPIRSDTNVTLSAADSCR